jgi:hypothetical protein
MDGKFRFSDLTPGTYTIVVKTPDYSDKVVQGIVVTNVEVTVVDIVLSTNTMEEVVFDGTKNRKQDTEHAATLIQKEANTFSEVVSGVTVQKTSAKNIGDVVKMSSGASIQDGKFAVIRGLNDRYNAAFLNGAPLPSTESDRKAFAFDMFPSNMLDNLVISKTATPEMPSEFAGGIIMINTKSIPDKNFITISAGGSYNTITTFKPRKTYEGGQRYKSNVECNSCIWFLPDLYQRTGKSCTAVQYFLGFKGQQIFAELQLPVLFRFQRYHFGERIRNLNRSYLFKKFQLQ